MHTRTDIRLALPSKGRLARGSLELLEAAGLGVHKPNPRQYMAEIPNLPNVTVLFQRAGDIVVGVRDGSVDFGITGWDVIAERCGENRAVLPLHKALGFGHCTLNLIVPDHWEEVRTLDGLARRQAQQPDPLRVATKFPNLTARFLRSRGLTRVRLIKAEGALEIAPTIGYADAIVDLVSSGVTLRENGLRALQDGQILRSQAALIANRHALRTRPEVLDVARQLLEFIVAHLRAAGNLNLFANIRGPSPEAIARRMLSQNVIAGLQGPTIAPVISPQQGDWFAANIVVRKDQLAQAIAELRAIGGSGVVVTPVTYIFEEEPAEYRAMLAALEQEHPLSEKTPC